MGSWELGAPPSFSVHVSRSPPAGFDMTVAMRELVLHNEDQKPSGVQMSCNRIFSRPRSGPNSSPAA